MAAGSRITPWSRHMIDIHCHLIPNVDDGPSSWAESIEMVELAAEDGTTLVYATPHWIQGSAWAPSPGEVRRGVEALNARIRKRGLDITVRSGMEVGVAENLGTLLRNGEVLTLGGGPCVLLETPHASIPPGFREIVQGIVEAGFVPVLAHPERNAEYQVAPELLGELTRDGALMQFTAGSLCGEFGGEALECSLECARMGIITCLASDGHSPRSRPPIMSEGLGVLGDVVGRAELERITQRARELFCGAP